MLKALLFLLPFFATCRGYIPHQHILAKQHKYNIVTPTSSSLYYSSLGRGRGSTNRCIFHDNSCSTNPPRIVGPHHADLFRIRGGGGVGGSTLNSSSTTSSSTQLALVLNPSLASLLSGSIAGAIGVGVAFPLDTLKTKSQVLLGKARGTGGDGVEGGGTKNAEFDIAGTTTAVAAAAVGSASVALSASSATTDAVDASKITMMQLINLIYRTEGIAGFFGGVKGMMVGQAIIKSVAFSANASALVFLNEHVVLPAAVSLLLAACFSGFVTSFLVTPIERVKVLMQATNVYKNEIDCLRAIIINDNKGILGVLGKGLGPTLAREVPSYGIYFLIYGLLMQLPIATELGVAAPLIFGALTGMASWIPVYPVDVVKTLVQTSDGTEDISALEVTVKLYQEGGIGAFFDGLTPKMLRAAVNHSVTFFIYDIIYQALTSQ